MAQKEFLSNAGLEHYDEKIKEYIGDHSSNDIVALKEESPATAAHSVGDYITYNHIVYEVIDDISVDDLLIVDSNIEVATLAEGTVIYSDDDNGGSSGTTNYNDLDNKPQVNGVELSGNKSATDLGLVASVEGKGLSTNDYDNTEKGKVADNTSAVEAITNVYGAKNFCPTYQNCQTTTVDGVTFTVYSNGSIKINGTSTADIDFDIIPDNACSLKPGSYILNGGLPKPEGNTYYLTVSVVTDVTWGEPLIEGALVYDGDTDPITINNVAGTGAYTLSMHIDSGVTISNKTIKPMIRDARIADGTFASYTMTNKELMEYIDEQIDTAITQVLNTSY